MILQVGRPYSTVGRYYTEFDSVQVDFCARGFSQADAETACDYFQKAPIKEQVLFQESVGWLMSNQCIVLDRPFSEYDFGDGDDLPLDLDYFSLFDSSNNFKTGFYTDSEVYLLNDDGDTVHHF